MPEVLPHYGPIEDWLLRHLDGKQTTIILGINGPQGSGKTTLSRYLVDTLNRKGLPAATLSIDDFYLTRPQQVALARGGNPYLQARGYPGTHDVSLGAEVLRMVKHLKSGSMELPIYNKAAYDGKGDRSEETRPIQGPLRCFILEGWMLGFPPLEQPIEDPWLRQCNEYLRNYREWTDYLDIFLHLEAIPMENVLAWRVQAEEQVRASGSGMTEEQVRAYVKLFLPAYQLYVPALRLRPPCSDSLHVGLGPDRLPIQ